MNCLYCGAGTKVINSRSQKRSNHTWRRRQCTNCKHVFTSIELPDLATSFVFLPSSGQVEPFCRDKLFLSVYNSLGHRKDALEASTSLTDTILSRLLKATDGSAIGRTKLIDAATEVLKSFDKAAAVQYSAYHPI